MINNLNEENDKLDMINKIIKPINNKIWYFFKSDNNKAVEKNLINIDGFWGSGKSTIVNNLEHYYQYKNDIEKPKFLIINLWEYETCPNPYDELLKSVFYGIFPHNNNLQKKEKIWVKWWSRIKRNRWQVESIDHDFYYIIKNDFSHKIGYKLTKHFTDLNDKIDDWIQKIKNNIQEKIVIIFDEIDRCTVNNQIIFLSYIKNIFFKITNIFFIVSSNNEVINQNIIKEYCKTDSKREKYTEKIFNNTINLTNIFPGMATPWLWHQGSSTPCINSTSIIFKYSLFIKISSFQIKFSKIKIVTT